MPNFSKDTLHTLSCPSIAPVQRDVDRPFWSVMIPTYNPNPAYLEETLNSILKQYMSPKEMQIELIDDCSSEFDPKTFLEKFRDDRISCYRQKRHSGIGGNWNTCIERARGHWVHLLHQDDLLLPGFYNRLREGIEKKPDVGAVCCRVAFINTIRNTKHLDPLLRETPGILDNWLEHIFISLKIKASAISVKRGVYEKLGGFNTDFDYALDWDMWKRIASSYPIWYEPEPLACYRYHEESASAEFINSGRNLVEIRKSIDISQSYLSEDISLHVSRQAKANYTKYGIAVAVRILLEQRDLNSAITQLREARKIGPETFLKSVSGVIIDNLLQGLRNIKSKVL